MPASLSSARGRSPVLGGVLLGVLILVAAIVYANSGRSGDGHEATSSASSGDVAVSLAEMRITPATITVHRGQHLVLRVTNHGSMAHDLRLSSGVQTPMLAPGQSAVLDAGVVTASLTGWCTVPGHRAAGMQMSIVVSGSSASTAPASGMGGMSGMTGSGTASAAPDATSPDLSGDPGTGWQAPAAALPAVGTGTVHHVDWQIEDVVREVAPGVRQQLWTFGGTAPGPVLHGRVGDTFVITVHNDTDMTHNLDFHAEDGPPAKVMTPIPPGGTHTYRFVARHAGAWLYHCGTMPMLQHMANGMYGAPIIDPPGLDPVSAQYVLVGSELFFGPQGDSGDYTKMLADKPDAVVFNGYPFAYERQPLAAKAGERVRIWVVAAGPSRSLAFHVVGAPFTAAYLDGHYLVRPGSRDGAAETLPVDPGDGGFVELTFSQAGSYPFLTHDMVDATLGASGTFAVTG